MDFITSASRVQLTLLCSIADDPGYAGVRINIDRQQALQCERSLEVNIMRTFLTIECPDDDIHDPDDVGGNDTGYTGSRQGRDYRRVGAHET